MTEKKKGIVSELFGMFGKKEEDLKKTPPKVVKPVAKKPAIKKSTAGADAKIKAVRDRKAASKLEKVMYDVTHQDLINVAYKAAEELKPFYR